MACTLRKPFIFSSKGTFLYRWFATNMAAKTSRGNLQFQNFAFLPNSVLNLTNHVLLDRCGEATVVLNEGFLHINQAAHLAKVSATYLRLISFVSLVIFKETNK